MAQAALSQRINAIEEAVKAHEEAINGNGKKGLKTDFAVLTERVDNLKKSVDGLSTRIWALVVVVAVEILAVGSQMLTHSGPFTLGK